MIFDTSIVIDHLRQKDRTTTVYHQLSATNPIRKISVITHCELYAGKSPWENSLVQEDLDKLFYQVAIIPLSLEISMTAGKLHAFQKVPLLDAIIAATAIAEDEPLVTLNPKHFLQVPNLKLAKLE